MTDKDVAIYEATEPFYADGMTIQAGDTLAAGHPIMKGREAFFRPFEPTYDRKRDEAAAKEAHRAYVDAVEQAEAKAKAAEEAAAAAVPFGELQERGKALGLKVSGVRRVVLEAAIAEAEAERAAEAARAEEAAARAAAEAAEAAATAAAEAAATPAEPEATG